MKPRMSIYQLKNNPDLNSGLLDLEPPAQEENLNNLVTPSPPAEQEWISLKTCMDLVNSES